jgi:single-stranded DNA-binding protein
MLRVTVMRNLGVDAELRSSPNEWQIASFRNAVNQAQKNAVSERQESQAEDASRLQKGQRVRVDGGLQITRFQRRDGTPGVG